MLSERTEPPDFQALPQPTPETPEPGLEMPPGATKQSTLGLRVKEEFPRLLSFFGQVLNNTSERSEESDELLSVAKNTYTIAFQILPPFGRLDDKGRKG